jgi:FkbM family methyltransferase
MPSLLKLKHHLVGTVAARPLNRVRSWTSLPMRRRHPELHGLFHESEFMDRAVRRLVTPTMNCIDGGCHIGAMLATFVEIAPEGHHIAFEPVAEKANWLRKRWPQAEIHQAAIGERAGQATFNENQKRPGMSSLRRENIEGDGITSYTVDIVTIDDVVGDREIGFLKLDVEGNELFALRGARKVLATSKPALLFECGPPWTLTPFEYTRGDLWDFLHDEAGYSVWLVSDYLFSREPMGRAEFERAGTYPFPGFNYIALPIGTELTPLEELDRSK